MMSNNAIGTNNNVHKIVLLNRTDIKTVLLLLIITIIINPSIIVGWNFISLSSSLSSKSKRSMMNHRPETTAQYLIQSCRIDDIEINQQQKPLPNMNQQQQSTKLSLPPQQLEMNTETTTATTTATATATSTVTTKVGTTRQQFLHKTIFTIISGTSSYILPITPKLCYGQEQQQQQQQKQEEKIMTSDDSSKALSTLLPIIQLQQKFRTIQNKLQVIEKQFGTSNSNNQQQQDIVNEKTLVKIENENDFKKVFDIYSDPISYKQKYINNNAFLVYYTKGFDGIGRPSIEDDPTLIEQTIQYSIRNDIWISYNNFISELLYQCKESTFSDDIDIAVLVSYISIAIQSLDTYLTYASPSDVQTCIQFLQEKKQQE